MISRVLAVYRRSSFSQIRNMSGMNIKIIPALKDNYMYLVIDEATHEAAVVDPANPDDVMCVSKLENANLTKVLTTHHHADHAGGNCKLLKLSNKSLPVYGGDERIDAINQMVKDNDKLKIGSLEVQCIFTPCHTTGHICYNIKAPNGDRAVFTGDTLFQGGCGRFFEGTPEQMLSSLKKLAALPDETKVYCGHEYSLQNMCFAAHVEPDNEAIKRRIEWIKERRACGLPTVPSTIGEEKSWNPFMRVHEDAVKKHTGENDPVKAMKNLRSEKDKFKSPL